MPWPNKDIYFITISSFNNLLFPFTSRWKKTRGITFRDVMKCVRFGRKTKLLTAMFNKQNLQLLDTAVAATHHDQLSAEPRNNTLEHIDDRLTNTFIGIVVALVNECANIINRLSSNLLLRLTMSAMSTAILISASSVSVGDSTELTATFKRSALSFGQSWCWHQTMCLWSLCSSSSRAWVSSSLPESIPGVLLFTVDGTVTIGTWLSRYRWIRVSWLIRFNQSVVISFSASQIGSFASFKISAWDLWFCWFTVVYATFYARYWRVSIH